MAQLAIKGHPTRGGEVIQLLEMLGGKSNGNMNGYNDDLYYYIAKDDLIYGSDKEYEELACNYTIYTLEEFEKKFPYKVGDIVKCHAIWKGLIESMEWYEKEVIYHVRSYSDDYLTSVTAKHLQPFEEETNMEDNKATGSRIDFSLTERVELDLGDTHEVVVENDKTYVVKKKPTYPKYYTECEASELSSNPVIVALAQGVCMGAFAKLIVLRNAYWEIAGKQLGLDKPWKYDTSKDEFVYAIVYQCERIHKCEVRYKNHILAFPTEEMRDAFYENFKELIEECKELL